MYILSQRLAIIGAKSSRFVYTSGTWIQLQQDYLGAISGERVESHMARVFEYLEDRAAGDRCLLCEPVCERLTFRWARVIGSVLIKVFTDPVSEGLGTRERRVYDVIDDFASIRESGQYCEQEHATLRFACARC